MQLVLCGLRDVRDYKAAAQRAGLPVDMATIERVAAADCETYDRVKRAAPVVAPQTAEQRAEIQRIRKEQRDAEAQQAGVKMVDPGKAKRRRVASMHAKSTIMDRWAHAKARVIRICAGMGRHRDPFQATRTCEMPDLAYEIYRIRANLVIRDRMPRPGDEPNPFFGMSDIDASRLMQRLVEDVCDRSTGRLGPWRTPK